MRLIIKLLGGQYRQHWFRTLLALSAVATSVTMVIVLVGQQGATVRETEAAQLKLAGSYELIANSGTESDVTGNHRRTGANPPLPPFPREGIEWMRSNPDVKEMQETCEMTVSVDGTGSASDEEGDSASVSSLYSLESAKPPRPLIRGRWLNPAGDDAAVVVDSDIAAKLRLVDLTTSPTTERSETAPARGANGRAGVPAPKKARGDQGKDGPGSQGLSLATVAGRFKVNVVGVLDSPGKVPGLTGIYVTPSLFARLAGKPPATNRVLLALKDASREETFIGQFDALMTRLGRRGEVRAIGDFAEDTGRLATTVRGTGPWFFPLLRDATAKIAVVAAFFIIFNTFSMGLEERTRQLAMLRAIGLTRGQLGLTALCDGLAIASIGLLLGLGVSAYALPHYLRSASRISAVAVHYDYNIGALVRLGAGTAFGTVLLATALPTVLAMRRRPLESMTACAILVPKSAPWWLALLAVFAIALNPLATLITAVPDSTLSAVVVGFSFVTAVVGFALLLPALLGLCEPVFASIAARALMLNPRMLRRHLSANLWRTVGCVAAIMVGLGLYTVVNIWGRSMAVPFMISPKSPDAIVTIYPGSLPESRLGELDHISGVTAALPIILEHPTLADLPSDTVMTGIDFFGPEMMYVGCDVDGIIDPAKGMLPAKFIRGNPAEARRQLDAGGTCLITDNLYRRFPKLYDVGKTLALDSGDDHRRIEHKIVGVVEIDGWHQFTKRVRMRRFGGRAGGLVIVPAKTAKTTYPTSRYQTLWFKLAPGVKPATLQHPILSIADPTLTDVALTPPRAHPDVPSTQPLELEAGSASHPAKNYCRVVDARNLIGNLTKRIDGAIESLATYPLWALALASVAVVNTMFASVRARSWEIGILRSVGLTRGQLLRQVLAEGLLIGLLASVASLLFGLLTSYTGIVASCRSMNVTAPYIVPWKSILAGSGMAIGICLVATTAPALLTARRETLRLLQQGRSMD